MKLFFVCVCVCVFFLIHCHNILHCIIKYNITKIVMFAEWEVWEAEQKSDFPREFGS